MSDFNSYQRSAAGTAIYPDQHKITYPALGMAGEAGMAGMLSMISVRSMLCVLRSRAPRSGLVGSCLNLLPALIPSILFSGHGSEARKKIRRAFLGLCGFLVGLLCLHRHGWGRRFQGTLVVSVSCTKALTASAKAWIIFATHTTKKNDEPRSGGPLLDRAPGQLPPPHAAAPPRPLPLPLPRPAPSGTAAPRRCARSPIVSRRTAPVPLCYSLDNWGRSVALVHAAAATRPSSIGPSWADPALRALGYDADPRSTRALIRAVHAHATSRITVPGVPVVPVPLFEVLDPRDARDYEQRVEPSAAGGRKMARAIAAAIGEF